MAGGKGAGIIRADKRLIRSEKTERSAKAYTNSLSKIGLFKS